MLAVLAVTGPERVTVTAPEWRCQGCGRYLAALARLSDGSTRYILTGRRGWGTLPAGIRCPGCGKIDVRR